MKSMLTWFLNIMAIIYWMFRIAVVFCEGIGIDFIIKSSNSAIEIPMLFITLLCIILIMKRKFLGGLVYFSMYAIYFSTEMINATSTTLSKIAAAIGIIIALANLLDVVIIGKGKSGEKVNKKTDWFYGNKKFDRELDDRADKNNYKIQ